MVTLNNTAEGGTNGTAVTTANSGGASGTAWDTVTLGTTGAITFDNTHAYGSLSYNCDSGTTFAYMSWSTSLGTLSEVWGRLYIYLPPPTQPPEIGLVRLTNGTSQVAKITLSTSGKIVLRNAADTLMTQTLTSVPVTQWVRIEWHCIPLAANGTLEVRLFNTPESITADESISVTNAALLTNLTQVQHGPSVSTLSGKYWLDSIIATTTGWVGPVVQPVRPTGLASAEVFGAHAVTPGTVSAGPAGIPSGEAFGTAGVGLGVALAGIPSGEAFGVAGVGLAVSPTGIASGEAMGSLVVSRGLGVICTGIDSAEAFGSTTLVYGQAVATTGIDSAEAFGVLVVTIPWLIAPAGIDSAEAFGTAARVSQWFLHPPVVREGPVADGPLFSRYKLYRGISIIQDADGSWRTARYPAQTELEVALRVYMGGRMYPLTSDDRTMLTAAGFGAYIEEI